VAIGEVPAPGTNSLIPLHVQRWAVPRQKALFAGTWYTDPDYDPYA